MRTLLFWLLGATLAFADRGAPATTGGNAAGRGGSSPTVPSGKSVEYQSGATLQVDVGAVFSLYGVNVATLTGPLYLTAGVPSVETTAQNAANLTGGTGTLDLSGYTLTLPPLQLRQGTASALAAYTPLSGEPVWTTDTKKLSVGDGTTAGGVPVVPTTVFFGSGTIGTAGTNLGGSGSPGAAGTVTYSGGFVNGSGGANAASGAFNGGNGGSVFLPFNLKAGNGGPASTTANGGAASWIGSASGLLSVTTGSGGAASGGPGGASGSAFASTLFFRVITGNGGTGGSTSGTGAVSGSIDTLGGGLFNLTTGNAGAPGTTVGGGASGRISDLLNITTSTGGASNGSFTGGNSGSVTSNLFGVITGAGGAASSSAIGGNGGNVSNIVIIANTGAGSAASGATAGTAGGNSGNLDVSGTSASGATPGQNGANASVKGMGAITMETNGGLFSLTTPTTIANTVTATTLFNTGMTTGQVSGTSYTLPANSLVPGAAYHVHAVGYYSDTATPTGLLTLSLGGTSIVATPAQTLGSSVTNLGWTYDADFVCQTSGSSGTVEGQSVFDSEVTALAADLRARGISTSAVTINTTTTEALDLKWTWSAASASNTTTCATLNVTRTF